MSLCSILIIDDNDLDRELLIRQIKKAKLTDQIYESSDGIEAIDFLQNYRKNFQENPGKFPPVLIFLDINMPRMNGFEFLEKFKNLREETNNYLSTILTMFTSSERQEDLDKATSYEFVMGYIVKMPRSADELRETVKSIFQINLIALILSNWFFYSFHIDYWDGLYRISLSNLEKNTNRLV